MSSRTIGAGAGLLAQLVCLCGVTAAVVFLFQVLGGSLSFLRGFMLQRRAQGEACPLPAHVVPGSYQADPPQFVGDRVVVTYTADCEPPGQPRQSIDGYMAEDSHGSGCGGSGSMTPVSPAASGLVTITVDSLGLCKSAGAAGLGVIFGYVTGLGVVTAQAHFASGTSTSAPVRAGRFVIVALNDTALCSVRALDASGAVLAENKLNWPGPKVTARAFP
jgi:hypothetical protein